MKATKILAIVEDLFSHEGAVVAVGGRHNSQQALFANYTAECLTSNRSLGFLEAGTGIGKSLGYILPAMVVLSLGKKEGIKPIIVSTHTRALQRQLIDKDIVLAVKALRKQGLDVPTYAYRMGKAAFFSPQRVASLIEELPEDEVTDEHTRLLKYCQNSCVHGNGMWIDYINEYGGLPDGVDIDDICLLDMLTPDNPAYTRHLQNAKEADLIITNHASILNNNIFTDEYHAVICDEAHEIEKVCRDLATHKSQLLRIKNSIIDLPFNNAAKRKALDNAAAIESILIDFDKNNQNRQELISDLNNKAILNEVEMSVIDLHDLMLKLKDQFIDKLDGNITHKDAQKIEKINTHLATLSAFKDTQFDYKRRAVAFSHVQRKPSIASISLRAGGIFSYRIKQLTKRIVMVSATMSNASIKNTSFTHICGNLGLKESSITTSCSIEPDNFGKLDFVIVDKGRSPIYIEMDKVHFDEKWLERTAKIINYAAKIGKTLVLTPSFKETKHLVDRLDCDYLAQDAKTPLMQLEPMFVKGDMPVLLSSGAWNGLSLRDIEGNQLIKNLVITRIPFVPVDEELNYLEAERMAEQGYSASKIESIQWHRQQYETVIKLKQGIGRACRAQDDEVTVFFADPRMPDPNHANGLISAIPKRFLQSYMQAGIFNMQTNSVDEKKQIILI